MNFTIRGQHIEVTDALKEYIDKKLGRLDRYFDTPPESEGLVTLNVLRTAQKGNTNKVEVTIPLPGNVILRAEDRSDDMYTSIDSVLSKLERQIRKHKTKLNRRIRQDESLKGLFVDEGANASVSPSTDEEEDELQVVRNKRFLLKPMDVEEAILQMNMIGHNFFVFSNIESETVNVVYRRNDGKYGLIEQE
ncbi:ribosome hibernation-promoting factor, HPF/YfiA family [Saccharibacillus kuerlensis]|uniref:Ribosome hibernation promoting factor n=1 Tax=Saccharibacillus kuerlensis TaxID=459527 RepID=A0ABQ2KTZ2_9BACL|nr:ribosome-associated translation inhibitor RaiA [Saccharibacillus kuerlensis]GGN93156.1 ribosomal subunit interface protein [Saccharibacillus kuerlensis]